MRILLDTNMYIYYIQGNEKKLGKKLLRELNENQNDNYLSIVSLWEVATKIRIGNLNMPANYIQDVVNGNLKLLYVEPEHIERYQTLPLHHRDPFDRMIIAQALCENMRVATSNDNFGRYSVKLLN